MVYRREFITAIGSVGGTVAIAGCTSSGSDSSSGQGSTGTGDDGASSEAGGDGASSEQSPEESTSTEDGDVSPDQSPEDAVEQYFTAFENGDLDVGNNLRYESEPLDEDDLPGAVTVVELDTEELTMREALQERRGLEGDELDAEVETVQAQINDRLAEVGAEDHTWVSYSLTTETDEGENTRSGVFHLILDDGAWLISIDFLQPQDDEPSDDSTNSASDRIQEESAVGRVNADGMVDEVTVTVTKESGADDISLLDVEFESRTGEGPVSGMLEEAMIERASAETDDFVITDSSDRYEITFTTEHLGAELLEGTLVVITLTTEIGASTMIEMEVPDNLEAGETVTL